MRQTCLTGRHRRDWNNAGNAKSRARRPRIPPVVSDSPWGGAFSFPWAGWDWMIVVFPAGRGPVALSPPRLARPPPPCRPGRGSPASLLRSRFFPINPRVLGIFDFSPAGFRLPGKTIRAGSGTSSSGNDQTDGWMGWFFLMEHGSGPTKRCGGTTL